MKCQRSDIRSSEPCNDSITAAFDEAATTLRAFIESPDGLPNVRRFAEAATKALQRIWTAPVET